MIDERRGAMSFRKLDDAERRAWNDRRATRRTTAEHERLVAALASMSSRNWAQEVLLSCLRHLATSSATESWAVEIVDGWSDGADALCVVYRSPHTGVSGSVGLRRTRADYDGDLDGLGAFIADYDLGEPVGAYADSLRYDEHGVGWWGTLDAELPRR